MSTDRDTTRIVRSWLRTDEQESADRVLDAVLARLDTTPQRRAGWLARRYSFMKSNTLRFGIAAVVIVAAMAGFSLLPGGQNELQLGSDPGPTPSPPPPSESSAGPVLFTSDRHGYELSLPDDQWQVIEYPGSWTLGGTFSEDDSGVDSLMGNGSLGNPFILFNSQPVPTGTTLEGWIADYDEANRAVFPQCITVSTEPGELDGEDGQFRRYSCDDGDLQSAELVALHAGRAYAVRVFGPEGPDYDPRPVLDEWLARFEFTD